MKPFFTLFKKTLARQKLLKAVTQNDLSEVQRWSPWTDGFDWGYFQTKVTGGLGPEDRRAYSKEKLWWSPLLIAMENQNMPIISYLLEKGANLTYTKSHNKPIWTWVSQFEKIAHQDPQNLTQQQQWFELLKKMIEQLPFLAFELDEWQRPIFYHLIANKYIQDTPIFEPMVRYFIEHHGEELDEFCDIDGCKQIIQQNPYQQWIESLIEKRHLQDKLNQATIQKKQPRL